MNQSRQGEASMACSEGCSLVASLRRTLQWERDEREQMRLNYGQTAAFREQKLAKEIHQSYVAKLAAYEDRLNALQDEHREELKRQQAESAAREKALKNKIIEQASVISLYQDSGPPRNKSEQFSGDTLDAKPHSERARGERTNPMGGGRNIPGKLPTEVKEEKLPERDRVCPDCGRSYAECGSKESHQVDFRVDLRRITTRRETWTPTCSCPNSKIRTAPLPLRAFPGRMLSDDAILEICLLKFEYHMPLNRVLKLFGEAGWTNASASTLFDAQTAFSRYLLLLESAIIRRNLSSDLWQVDESSLPVFLRREGYQSFYWTIWQIRSPDTIVHYLTSTRAAEQIRTYFADKLDSEATLVVDRAKVYPTLPFLLAYCWAHVRRDFIRLGRYTKGNRTFALEWLRMIRTLYRCFKASRREPDNAAWRCKLVQHIQEMQQKFICQLEEKLPEKRRKVLESLLRHWVGLSRFLDDPRIPLDNNDVERIFRAESGFKNSSFGCHSANAAEQVARFFTIFHTLKLNGIPLKPYFRAYLRAIAENNATPPSNADNWMPWSMTEDVRRRIAEAADSS